MAPSPTTSPAYPPCFERNDPHNGRGFDSAVAYAIVVNKRSKYANASSLAALRGASIGVQITTSLDAVGSQLTPTKQPKVFNNSNDVVTALKQRQVDAVVVDLPTAFYLTSAQVPTAKIVGQFSAPGGDTWGALLAKNSPLTTCVNRDEWRPEMSGVLELRGVTKAYGERAGLRGIDLVVAEHSAVALIGASGSGKSTSFAASICSRRSTTATCSSTASLEPTSFLHEGRIAEQGAPEQIFSSPRVPETQRFLRRMLAANRL